MFIVYWVGQFPRCANLASHKLFYALSVTPRITHDYSDMFQNSLMRMRKVLYIASIYIINPRKNFQALKK